MSLKTINDLFLKKKSDTLVIFGCGPSINNLSIEDLNILSQFDTMSFNLFCKTQIPVDIYIVGETLHHYYDSLDRAHLYGGENENKYIKNSKEDPESYFKLLNHKAYKNSFIVLWDRNSIIKRKETIYKNLTQNKIHLKTKCIGVGTNYIDKSIYNSNYLKKNKILLHQNVGLNSCIFLGMSMGYKRIVFSGVDLNNYKYAFDRNYFREKLIRKNINTPHRSLKHVFSFINYLKNDIKFEVYNKDSKLTQIIPIFKNQEK
tara:strand:+ start:2960 stop:3739 length:780 start_codon:yes stop_codon:yes gene_type:complete